MFTSELLGRLTFYGRRGVLLLLEKYGKARRIKEFRHIREFLLFELRSCLHHVVKLINSSSCLPSKCLTLRVLHDESRLLLQQLNGEGVGDNHKHHWHIKREQRAEDEEGSVVDGTDSRLRHDVLVIDDACNVKSAFAFPCSQFECTHPSQ
jgi:hypothetical protein